MAEEGNPWPDWSKPATKGDLISALADVHTILVDIVSVLIAIDHGNDTTARDKTAKLFESIKKLPDKIDMIGGMNNE